VFTEARISRAVSRGRMKRCWGMGVVGRARLGIYILKMERVDVGEYMRSD